MNKTVKTEHLCVDLYSKKCPKIVRNANYISWDPTVTTLNVILTDQQVRVEHVWHQNTLKTWRFRSCTQQIAGIFKHLFRKIVGSAEQIITADM